jgi:hypothetical protein
MSEQASPLHSIRVKIGGDEFEASGTEQSVKEQYSLFLSARSTAPSLPARRVDLGDVPPPPPPELGIPPETVQMVFSVRGESVSLNALPRGENADADALIMLLWGFAQLRNTTAVTAGVLMAAARTSGLQLDRIDRVLSSQQMYVLRAGAKRGTRYSLTNPGRQYAANLIATLHS